MHGISGIAVFTRIILLQDRHAEILALRNINVMIDWKCTNLVDAKMITHNRYHLKLLFLANKRLAQVCSGCHNENIKER